MKATRPCEIEYCDRDRVADDVPVCLNHGVGIWNHMHDIVNERIGAPQGDRLMTRQQIRLTHPTLNASTFRQWVSRKKITPARETAKGEPLYWLSDIEALMNKGNGPLPLTHDPVVYYLELHNGNIKIGYTTDLRSRLAALRYSGDNLLATEPGGRPVELLRHGQFDALRVGRREEFRPGDTLLAHIAKLSPAVLTSA